MLTKWLPAAFVIVLVCSPRFAYQTEGQTQVDPEEFAGIADIRKSIDWYWDADLIVIGEWDDKTNSIEIDEYLFGQSAETGFHFGPAEHLRHEFSRFAIPRTVRPRITSKAVVCVTKRLDTRTPALWSVFRIGEDGKVYGYRQVSNPGPAYIHYRPCYDSLEEMMVAIRTSKEALAARQKLLMERIANPPDERPDEILSFLYTRDRLLLSDKHQLMKITRPGDTGVFEFLANLLVEDRMAPSDHHDPADIANTISHIPDPAVTKILQTHLEETGFDQTVIYKMSNRGTIELVDYLKDLACNEMLDDGVRETAATTVARIVAAPWIDDRPAFNKHRLSLVHQLFDELPLFRSECRYSPDMLSRHASEGSIHRLTQLLDDEQDGPPGQRDKLKQAIRECEDQLDEN